MSLASCHSPHHARRLPRRGSVTWTTSAPGAFDRRRRNARDVPVATPAALMTGTENAVPRHPTRSRHRSTDRLRRPDAPDRSDRGRCAPRRPPARASSVDDRSSSSNGRVSARNDATSPRSARSVSSTLTRTTTRAANPSAQSSAARMTARSPALIDSCSSMRRAISCSCPCSTRSVPTAVGQLVRKVLLGHPTTIVVMRVLVPGPVADRRRPPSSAHRAGGPAPRRPHRRGPPPARSRSPAPRGCSSVPSRGAPPPGRG